MLVDDATSLYLSQFFILAGAHFLALMSPGPDFAVIISQSVRYGRRIGIYTAIGIGLGIGLHVLYSLFGVALLFKTHAWAMTTAKVLAAGYLLWMSYHLLRAKPHVSPLQDTDEAALPNTPNPKQAFWRGFLTNATNPKATLFFLSMFATVIAPQTPVGVKAMYGVWLCFSTGVWFCLVATLLTKPRIRQQFLRLGHWFDRVMGAVLVLLAIRLLWDEIQL